MVFFAAAKVSSSFPPPDLPEIAFAGLRISQFSEDNVGPTDPSQKSITNFVMFGDASGSNVHGNDSLKLKDHDVENDIADDFASCDHTYDCPHSNAFTSDQLSDFGYSSSCISENGADMRGNIDPLSNIQARESAPASKVHILELHDPDACQSSDTKLPDRNCKNADTSNTKNDDLVPSSSLQVQFCWVDDYKCSICGIEMPPEFVYERQEHSDFHLAERLQEECSSSSLTNHLSNTPKRVTQTASPGTQKRRKSTAEQGKYHPIDKFFKKTTHNM